VKEVKRGVVVRLDWSGRESNPRGETWCRETKREGVAKDVASARGVE
jgi:hypothetical protein